MTPLEQAISILPEMSENEIAQFLQRASQKITSNFQGIEKTPGVFGGSACVLRSQVPVWEIVEKMRLGVGNEKLLQNFPTLRAEDLTHAWAYFNLNREEIEGEIFENYKN